MGIVKQNYRVLSYSIPYFQFIFTGKRGYSCNILRGSVSL